MISKELDMTLISRLMSMSMRRGEEGREGDRREGRGGKEREKWEQRQEEGR